MSTQQNDLLRQLVDGARAKVAQAEQEISRLAALHSPNHLLAAAVVVRSCVPQGADPHHGTTPATIERLAFHLWRADVAGTSAPTAEAMYTLLEAAEALHSSSLFAFQVPDSDDVVGDLLTQIRTDVETVRGSAYAFQSADAIRAIYAPFDDWFLERLGCSASALVDTLLAMDAARRTELPKWMNALATTARGRFGRPSKGTRRAYQDWMFAAIAADAAEKGTIGRADVALPDRSTPSEDAWAALLSLVGLTPERVQASATLSVSRERPLLVFPGQRVQSTSLPHVLDRLMDSLDTVAKADQPFYNSRLQPHKADWLEERVHTCLTRVFGAGPVYRTLDYPNPDKPGHTAELDAAVKWGPFLLLVEAKARQFRIEGQLGDITRLRNDLKANVEDAFQQALRARRYLASVDEAEFVERHTARTLRVKNSSLRRVYLATISLHDLGAAISNLVRLRQFGFFATEEYPWPVSLAVLDLISGVVEGPDVLLHFLERRVKIESDTTRWNADDLDFFGAYLHTRLHPDFFQDAGRRPDFISLSPFQEVFDALVEYREGDTAQPPDVSVKLPPEVRSVLTELRRREHDDSARYIAFALLGLSNSQLWAVAALLRAARKQDAPAGVFRRLADTVGDLALSVTIARGTLSQALAERTAQRAAIEKYRRRTIRSIAFGIDLSHAGAGFDHCAWLEGEWTPDPALDALLASEPPSWVAPGQKLPGRNDTCVCGSGKKFKKCCLRRLEAMPPERPNG